MKKVALILDHPSRDLDYISDIALTISESGIKTYIVPSNMRHRELLLLRPDYVLYPNHRDTSASEIRILKEVGVSIGVLETEQCVSDSFFEKYQIPKNIQTLKTDILDFFVWGEYFSNLCISKNWYDQSQIKIAGSPKHDRYFSQKNLSTPKEYDILIATSFPNSNPLSGHEVSRQMYQDIGLNDTEIDIFNQLHVDNVQNTIDFINNELSNTELKVLLRVHPYEENYQLYKNKIKSKNIVIENSNHTIISSLNKAKILIHFNSSACIDAQACGVPSINMSWMPQLEVFHDSSEIMTSVSYQPKSTTECIQLIHDIISEKFKLKIENNSEEMKKFIFKFDGLSSKRCANLITSSVSSDYNKLNLDIEQNIFIKKYNPKSFLVSLILRYRWKKTKKYFNRKDIEKSLAKNYSSVKLTNPKRVGVNLTSVELL